MVAAVAEAAGRVTLAALALALALTVAAEARSWSWLGVRIRDMSEQEMEEISARHGIREGFGVVIVEVLAGTPAALAGLRNGDIVVALNGRPVTETRLLQRLIAASSMEADTRVTVLRREGRRHVAVRLAVMPREMVGDRVAAEFGFVLREAEPGEPAGARSPSRPPSIITVLRGGPAAKAGLEVGDVVLELGDRAVVTREAARDALADAPLDRPLQVTIRRGEHRLGLTILPP